MGIFATSMIIDGSVVDILSLVSAVASPLVKPCRRMWLRKFRPETDIRKWTQGECVADVLNGASLVPFVLLVGCVVSSELLKTALETSKVFMGIGGLIGIVFVAGEIYRLPDPALGQAANAPALASKPPAKQA